MREEISRGLAYLERQGALAVSPDLIEVKDLQRLERLERAVQVDQARADCDSLRSVLTEATDHAELAETGRELAAAEERLERAEEAWLELADQIEARGLEI